MDVNFLPTPTQSQSPPNNLLAGKATMVVGFVDGLSAVHLYYVNVDGGASRNKCRAMVRSII